MYAVSNIPRSWMHSCIWSIYGEQENTISKPIRANKVGNENKFAIQSELFCTYTQQFKTVKCVIRMAKGDEQLLFSLLNAWGMTKKEKWAHSPNFNSVERKHNIHKYNMYTCTCRSNKNGYFILCYITIYYTIYMFDVM